MIVTIYDVKYKLLHNVKMEKQFCRNFNDLLMFKVFLFIILMIVATDTFLGRYLSHLKIFE